MLVMVTVGNWKYPYGTICQVISERKNIYTVIVAEIGSKLTICKDNVREI